MIGSTIKPLRIQDAYFHVNDTLPVDSNKIKSEARLTASILKQDPSIKKRLKRTLFIRSKHIKDSNERYLLGEKHNLQISRVVPFVKLQNIKQINGEKKKQ